MTDTTTPTLRYTNVWATSNGGILRSIYRTRSEAIKETEHDCGEPWSKCRKYMEVRKVRVLEGWE